MKYSMVRQFSNGAIDNAYSFLFKLVDFFKVLYELMWAFFEIWAAFFLVFYNIFMYIYYLILFVIDRGSEQSGPIFRFKKMPGTSLSAPSIKIPTGANPIPAMYGGARAAASSTASSAQQTISSLRPSGTGAKRNILKTVLEFFASLFEGIRTVVMAPFRFIAGLFDRAKAAREKERDKDREKGPDASKSLIDEYMKEYNRRKR